MTSTANTNAAETVAALARLMETAEKMRNAYFFHAPGNASARRSYEKRNSVPVIRWTEGGHAYTAAYNVRCTCSSVYASGEYTKDGQKTTLTAIRNSYKRLISA